MRGANRTDSTSAIVTGMVTMKMIVAPPVSPEPISQRGTHMNTKPRNAATAPVAMATAFMVTTCSRGTTCGNAADSPEDTNRLNPVASNAAHNTSRSPAPTASKVPIPSTNTSRATLAAISTSRRSHRSSSAPANGPSSE
ncbi:hypothetical protein C1Y40_00052 [Mycobacterium talmoniae]|uniref:Uncharacterized protein n=1 Tax=Mycobacterium talmoniae TaxID=1858794 RepID=A0A2S8BSR7_9MYCO|nr:hypothetical protein C1Y40_00052 [Mycobacterium talmoniae]